MPADRFSQETSTIKKGESNISYNECGMNSYRHQFISQAASTYQGTPEHLLLKNMVAVSVCLSGSTLKASYKGPKIHLKSHYLKSATSL